MRANPSRREIRRAVERLRVDRDTESLPAPTGGEIEVDLSPEHAAELREWRRSPDEAMSDELAEAIRRAEMAAVTEAIADE